MNDKTKKTRTRNQINYSGYHKCNETGRIYNRDDLKQSKMTYNPFIFYVGYYKKCHNTGYLNKEDNIYCDCFTGGLTKNLQEMEIPIRGRRGQSISKNIKKRNRNGRK